MRHGKHRFRPYHPPWGGRFLASLLWQGLSIANYYTLAFRGTIMMPSDILAAGTAFNVLGNYRITFPMPVCLAFLSLIFIALLAGSLINVRYFRRKASKSVWWLALPLWPAAWRWALF